MATVRLSLNGIAKAYNLSKRQVASRLKQIGVPPRTGSTPTNPLYTEQDVRDITGAKPPKGRKVQR